MARGGLRRLLLAAAALRARALEWAEHNGVFLHELHSISRGSCPQQTRHVKDKQDCDEAARTHPEPVNSALSNDGVAFVNSFASVLAYDDSMEEGCYYSAAPPGREWIFLTHEANVHPDGQSGDRYYVCEIDRNPAGLADAQTSISHAKQLCEANVNCCGFTYSQSWASYFKRGRCGSAESSEWISLQKQLDFDHAIVEQSHAYDVTAYSVRRGNFRFSSKDCQGRLPQASNEYEALQHCTDNAFCRGVTFKIECEDADGDRLEAYYNCQPAAKGAWPNELEIDDEQIWETFLIKSRLSSPDNSHDICQGVLHHARWADHDYVRVHKLGGRSYVAEFVDNVESYEARTGKIEGTLLATDPPNYGKIDASSLKEAQRLCDTNKYCRGFHYQGNWPVHTEHTVELFGPVRDVSYPCTTTYVKRENGIMDFFSPMWGRGSNRAGDQETAFEAAQSCERDAACTGFQRPRGPASGRASTKTLYNHDPVISGARDCYTTYLKVPRAKTATTCRDLPWGLIRSCPAWGNSCGFCNCPPPVHVVPAPQLVQFPPALPPQVVYLPPPVMGVTYCTDSITGLRTPGPCPPCPR